MKRTTLLAVAIMATVAGFAQKDTTKRDADTIRIGNLIIIKKNKDGSSARTSDTVTNTVKVIKKPSNVATNWWILDLGFANMNDKTVYGSADANSYLNYTVRPGQQPFTKDDLDLRNGKTTNINLWFFMQRLNVTKGIVNLKYGLGLEMFNFRYDNNITYHKNPAYIFRDTVNFTKNKLYTSYISVPFMLNINTRPGKKQALSFSGGVSAGYLVGSRNKQISAQRGKEKIKGDFDLEKFRVAYIGELGLGPVRLFGSYSVNPMHERGLKQYPYSFGIRLSNF
jgi:hypothetical protein